MRSVQTRRTEEDLKRLLSAVGILVPMRAVAGEKIELVLIIVGNSYCTTRILRGLQENALAEQKK